MDEDIFWLQPKDGQNYKGGYGWGNFLDATKRMALNGVILWLQLKW